MSSHDTSSLPAVVVTAGIVGLLMGSFVNVVAYRVPLGLSVNHPRSFCPTCRHQLSWWENVPLVSWLVLRRRCHHCAAPISARYPAVELAMGLSFAWVAWEVGGGWRAAASCSLVASFVAVALIEASGRAAPIRLALIGTSVALALLVPPAVGTGRADVFLRPLVASLLAVMLVVVRRRLARGEAERPDGAASILVAACWLGSLDVPAVVVALAGGMAAGATCALVPRLVRAPTLPAGGSASSVGQVLTVAWVDLAAGTAMVLGLAVQSWR